MSTLDVVAGVLREVAPRALKAREIAALAGNRLPTASRTPETVVSRDLAVDVKARGAASRFLRVDRGAFVLKEALPTAFYNDVDPYVAKWTRNLIEAGHLAPGVVDERSIRDLKPADVASYRQCHFFSGIGVWSRVLRDAGWPDDAHVWSGSCPCTPFSSAGRKRGFSDEQHLWPEWYRLIAACRPALFVGEQVSSKDGLAWLDAVRVDLEAADYAFRVLDIPAACAGAPHARHRLYFVAYARERGREILGAPWLHDRGQSGNNVARRSSADRGGSCAVSDAAVARPRVSQDHGADRGDARAGTEAIEWRSTGDLEFERGRDADEAGNVPDAKRVMRDAGWQRRSHGWPEVEFDRHGEAHGARCNCFGTIGMGDTGFTRSGRNAGEVLGAEAPREGERIEARDLADELVASGADDGALGNPSVDESSEGVEMVRGAAGDSRHAGATGHGFIPGDRVRLDDPSWGGAVGGFWADAVEWVYCRPEPGHEDGRWRPVESGTFALVDGPAPSVGRTRAKRLRGYGNAIVRPLAVAFVESVLDTFVDAALSRGLSAPALAAMAAPTDPEISLMSVDVHAEESAA
jgi:site-specific DNA-cytosine methylase